MVLEERVIDLESLFARYLEKWDLENIRRDKENQDFKDEMKDFKDEMKDFKDEMKDFKNEMKDFKDEMKEFKNEMKEFKNEMKDFKKEMQDFKDFVTKDIEESRKERIRFNKQLGEISNKQGKLVEDFASPSVPRIIKEKFNIEIERQIVRYKRKLRENGELYVKEYDIIDISDEFLFIGSVKSWIDAKDVDQFIDDLHVFGKFFPELAGKRIIGLMASLSIDEHILKYIEKKGFLAMALGEDLMDMVNNPGFEPKIWDFTNIN